MRKNIIFGIIIILINFFHFYFYANFFYQHHFSGRMIHYYLPDWVVVLNIIIGLIGIILGSYLIANKIKLRLVLVIEFILLGIALWSLDVIGNIDFSRIFP